MAWSPTVATTRPVFSRTGRVARAISIGLCIVEGDSRSGRGKGGAGEGSTAAGSGRLTIGPGWETAAVARGGAGIPETATLTVTWGNPLGNWVSTFAVVWPASGPVVSGAG